MKMLEGLNDVTNIAGSFLISWTRLVACLAGAISFKTFTNEATGWTLASSNGRPLVLHDNIYFLTFSKYFLDKLERKGKSTKNLKPLFDSVKIILWKSAFCYKEKS